jgi:hypothetical protein
MLGIPNKRQFLYQGMNGERAAFQIFDIAAKREKVGSHGILVNVLPYDSADGCEHLQLFPPLISVFGE